MNFLQRFGRKFIAIRYESLNKQEAWFSYKRDIPVFSTAKRVKSEEACFSEIVHSPSSTIRLSLSLSQDNYIRKNAMINFKSKMEKYTV